MKITHYTRRLIMLMTAASLFAMPVMAEQSDSAPTPPSTENIPEQQQPLKLETNTVYETSFLPGVRLCEEDEVDYRGDFRKVNCQDEQLINSVSTSKYDSFSTKPTAIVDDRIEPNGNIFRINFKRKATVVENTSEN